MSKVKQITAVARIFKTQVEYHKVTADVPLDEDNYSDEDAEQLAILKALHENLGAVAENPDTPWIFKTDDAYYEHDSHEIESEKWPSSKEDNDAQEK